jgi:putative transposase
VTVGSGTVRVRAPRVNDKRVEEQTGERARLADPAEVCAPLAEGHRGAADPVSARALDRRLRSGAAGPARRGRLGSVGELDPAANRELAVRARGVPQGELRFHQYAYWFVDGVHVSVRLGEDARLCLLVVIGVHEDGAKELLAVEDGYARAPRAGPA